jgi:hypothetical protein
VALSLFFSADYRSDFGMNDFYFDPATVDNKSSVSCLLEDESDWLKEKSGAAQAAPLAENLQSVKLSTRADIQQQTAYEINALAKAVADGPSRRSWESVEGDRALRHVVEGQTVQALLIASLDFHAPELT